MNISASSLFRFTTKFEYLKEIVTSGFGFRPLTEQIAIGSYENDPFGGTDIVIDQLHSLAVCFCDLPLSQTSDHLKQYGNYAIGMSKDWAMQNNITPIRYYHAQSPDQCDSTTRLMLDTLCDAQHEKRGVMGVLIKFLGDQGASPAETELEQLPDSVKRLLDASNELMVSWLEHYWKTFNFTRIYEGEWTDRTTGEKCERRFYDEREWRAVGRDSRTRLNFKFADIKHIIVTSDAEHKEVASIIRSLADDLEVADETAIWRVIKVGSDIYPDV